MKKAILSKKDQVLHKLVLYEVRENSHLLDKFITEEQLKAMYDNMVWVEDNHIFIRNTNFKKIIHKINLNTEYS